MADSEFPSVPSQMFSALGDLPVDHKPLEDCLGQILFNTREVELAVGLHPATEWATYCHEMTHLVLHDSGLSNRLDERTEEAICDAFGSYLAAAVRAGRITIK
jgi:hypothetical protein